MPSFSAVLLAGGQSTRMGRDKALLTLPGSNLLLWQRQLHVLEELKPEEIFWSGPARENIPAHVRIIPDEVENAGPLGGISACLNVLKSDLLVVLAIDLPCMNAAFFKSLLNRCSVQRGAVPKHDKYFEPLATVYPKFLKALAADHLAQKRYSLQDFIRAAMLRYMIEAVPLDESDALLFKNVNAPADLKES